MCILALVLLQTGTILLLREAVTEWLAPVHAGGEQPERAQRGMPGRAHDRISLETARQ